MVNSGIEKPCRILLLNERDPEHPKQGGAETHVYELFGRLATRGYEITHLSALFGGAARNEELAGIKIRRPAGLPLYYPAAAWLTRRETHAGRFDLVVECLNKVPFYSPLYSSVPVLALCHHLFGEVAFQQVAWPIAATVWAAERLIPSVYGDCRFLAISESTRGDLQHRGIAEDLIRVSHPGIRQPHDVAIPEAHRRRGVVYVGRLEAYKHIDVMLRAMAELAHEFPDTPITIIGQGRARRGLESLARELGLGSRTRFTGFVSDRERDRLLAQARVCVCPSEKEGWGLTVVESNAVGTPVVASDADGLRDSVRDGETGFLVRAGDVSGFAKRIGALLGRDDLALKMSASARSWAKRFDWEVASDDLAQAIARARGIQ